MKKYLLYLIPLVSSLLAAQELTLADVFSPHMVLQRDQSLPIWGTSTAGTSVRVQFRDQLVETPVDDEGGWRVLLQPESASFEPATLHVRSGEQHVEIKDVLVGEVWLCSGQSNMQWTVRQTLDGDLEALTGHLTSIRLFKLPRVTAETPQTQMDAAWSVADPESISHFSSVGYHFGKTLHVALGVPIGLIDSSWGGTPAIAWTRPDALNRHPLLQIRTEEWEEGVPRYEEEYSAWEIAFQEWKQAEGIPENTRYHKRHHSQAPQPPEYNPKSPHRPGGIANAMISPLIPFALRGVIWYQGESDAYWEPARYGERLEVMITDWREAWRNPELYFGIVQLANFQRPLDEPSDTPWANLRESQRLLTRRLPHAGLAVAIDAGEANDIHPWDKQVVGRRLARLALVDVYDKLSLRGGPEVASAHFFEDRVELQFDQTGSGLHALNGEPVRGFTLAGDDGVFHVAEARIEQKTNVIVRSEAVPAPVHLRYGWQMNPVDINLVNRERLPAGPFEVTKPLDVPDR